MTVEPMPDRRRQSRPSRSHEEIYDLVEATGRKADDAAHRADNLTLVVQRVEGKIDGLLKVIGGEGEDERGQKVGTGLIGRLMRLEETVSKRFGQYDGWAKLVIGFCAAAAIFLPALWWLTSGKLEAMLK